MVRIARGLLHLLLPRDAHPSVIGELDEEYVERWQPLMGTRRASLRYWRESLSLILTYGRIRLLRGRSRDEAVVLQARRLQRRSGYADLSVPSNSGKGNSMVSLGSEMRHVLRSLRRSPSFTAVAVLTLALGIGANTAVYTVVRGVLLTPLPYAAPGELVRLYEHPPGEPDGREFVTGASFAVFRDEVSALDAVAGVYDYRETGATLTGQGSPRRVRTLAITAGYFDLLGTELWMGREFVRDEEFGTIPNVVLSHGLWRSLFEDRGAGDEALGSAVQLDGVACTVIGVTPRGFRDPLSGGIELWVPRNIHGGSRDAPYNHYLTVLGRLRSGVGLDQAQAEVEAATTRLNEEYGQDYGYAASIHPLQEDIVGPAGRLLTILLGAVGLVLLMACVNVANLLLARGAGRIKEFAIRSALGSGRGRLFRQVLFESLILGVAGGLTGLLMASGGVAALRAMAPASLPRLEDISFGAPVFLFGLIVSLVAAGLFGILPALRHSRPDIERSLRESGRGVAAGGRRLRGALVVVQVTVALVLLAGTGLLLRTFWNLRSVDLGVETKDILTFEVNLPGSRYDAPDRARFHREFIAAVERIPGVLAAGAVSRLPVTGNYHAWGFQFLDRDRSTSGWSNANMRIVEGDYFETVGMRLLEGRRFLPVDDDSVSMKAIVSRSLREQYYPDEDVLGKPIETGGDYAEIIGVVNDVRIDYEGETPHKIYLSHNQFAEDRNWNLTTVVRTEPGARGTMDEVRAILAGMDPEQVAHDVRPLTQVVGRGIEQQRFAMVLMLLFAAIGLSLATVGLYGVLAYSVERRGREIGIRMALGATGGRVRWMILSEGLQLAGIGIVLGVVLAVWVTRVLASMVYEVSPTDPTTFALVAFLLLGAAAAAGLLPAGRATRTDPIETLNAE